MGIVVFGGFLFVQNQSYVFTQILDLFSCSFSMLKRAFLQISYASLQAISGI